MSVIPKVVRVSYVNLVDPKAINPGDDSKKFSVCVMIPKRDSDALRFINTQIEAAIEKGKEKKWKGVIPKNLKSILRDGDDEQVSEGGRKGPEFKDHYFFNAYAQEDQRPGTVKVVDGKLVAIDPSEVYSGCFVRVDVNFYPYAGMANGVAAALNNLLFVKDGERLDGKVSAETSFMEFVGAVDEGELQTEGELM